MISGYQSALSGLSAYTTRLQSNANNIANIQSEGFKKTRVTLSDVQPNGVRANVEKIDTPGNTVLEENGKGMEIVEQSNVELSEELPQSMLNSTFYKANLKTIEVIDETTQSLLNIKA